jgi:hypothetical protein
MGEAGPGRSPPLRTARPDFAPQTHRGGNQVFSVTCMESHSYESAGLSIQRQLPLLVPRMCEAHPCMPSLAAHPEYGRGIFMLRCGAFRHVSWYQANQPGTFNLFS